MVCIRSVLLGTQEGPRGSEPAANRPAAAPQPGRAAVTVLWGLTPVPGAGACPVPVVEHFENSPAVCVTFIDVLRPSHGGWGVPVVGAAAPQPLTECGSVARGGGPSPPRSPVAPRLAVLTAQRKVERKPWHLLRKPQARLAHTSNQKHSRTRSPAGSKSPPWRRGQTAPRPRERGLLPSPSWRRASASLAWQTSPSADRCPMLCAHPCSGVVECAGEGPCSRLQVHNPKPRGRTSDASLLGVGLLPA